MTARIGGLAMALAMVSGAALAEGDAALSAKHVALAEAAAGDLFPAALGQCKDIGKSFVIPADRIDGYLATVVNVGGPRPLTVFDNLYYVGTDWVSAWAIETSDGIILFDALNNAEEAEKHIAGGLRELGLDPADIRKVIVAHAHGDHYGGAAWLKETYGAEIVMSETDWRELEKPRLQYESKLWDAPPARDVSVTDGDKVVLGDTTVEIVETPGHTPGTIGAVFEVRDGDETHKAVIWGGNGLNFGANAERFVTMMGSAEKVRTKVEAEGIDVFLSNHPGLDSTLRKAAAIGARGPDGGHPMVIGTTGVARFITALRECIAAQLASFAPEAVPQN